MEVASVDKFELEDESLRLNVVAVTANWAKDECQPICDALTVLAKDEAAAKRPDGSTIRFVSVDGETTGRELCLRHGINSVPSILCFKGAKLTQRIDGLKVGEAVAAVRRQIEVFDTETQTEASIQRAHAMASNSTKVKVIESKGPQDTLEDRLKALICQSRVVLFMKGDPEQPRCGFSRTTVALLTEVGCDFTHFNILSDEDVRQGLKKFSDWPTYPQLYVDGELIGGLDILQEMHKDGELRPLLCNEGR